MAQGIDDADLPPADAASPHLRLILLCGILLAAGGFVALLKLAHPQGLPFAAGVLAIEGLCALGLIAVLRTTSLSARAASFAAAPTAYHRRAAWCLIGAGTVGSLVLVWVLRAFPNSGDEYDYLFQAWTFLAGRLWNPVPPDHEFFAFYWQVFRDGKWTTLYPPGWPAFLATVMALRLPPWLASPLAGGILLFALFKLGQHRNGPVGGVLAVGLAAVSPFFIFNSASYFMHVPAAAAGLLFCWACIDFLDEPRSSRAWLAGVALGTLGLIRPEDVPLFGLPFCYEFLRRARRLHYRHAPEIILGGLPFLAALLLYNHEIMGSILPNLVKYYPSLKIGLFSVDEFGSRFTPLDQLRFVLTRVILLAQWTSPLLVLGYAAAFAWIATQRRLSFLDFAFPLFIIGYLLWPAWGGNQYGPRYYFEGFPLLALTVVSGVAPILQEMAHPRRAAFATLLIMTHCVICVISTAAYGIIFRVIINQRMDLYDQVEAKHLRDAVVVIRSATGRLSPMEPMDLTRNGIVLDGKVIYALEIPHRIEELQRLLPHRRFYVYERKPNDPKGALRLLE